MEKSTPLYQQHLARGASIVPFAGWQMPLHYGSQIEEHHLVRNKVGVFDVSHMLAIEIQGLQATDFLRRLLANDIVKLSSPGEALYSCMLNEQAGIIDDLIVYRLGLDHYRCVVNAATAEKDTAWIQKQSQSFNVNILPRRDLALLAVQGPATFQYLSAILPQKTVNVLQAMPPFHFLTAQEWVIARTGYTGEMGVEIMLPVHEVVAVWERLLAGGVSPIGLGARDSLRLEAGLNLYGTDMDESVTPDESNLRWTVDLKDGERDFIGKRALLELRQQGITRQLLGLVLLEKGVCRSGMRVLVEQQAHWLEGRLTSGSFSPTLACGIGLARIPIGTFNQAQVEIRGKRLAAKLIKPPFIRKEHG